MSEISGSRISPWILKILSDVKTTAWHSRFYNEGLIDENEIEEAFKFWLIL